MNKIPIKLIRWYQKEISKKELIVGFRQLVPIIASKLTKNSPL